MELDGSKRDEATPGLWGRARERRRRFLDRYEQRHERHARGEINPLTRPLRVTAGVLLILLGVAIGWLPGPGFVILAFPGALLIASEWRRAALVMDAMENEAIPRVRRVRARLRGGPKPEWVEEDPQLWGIDGDRRGAVDAPDSGERRRRSDVVDLHAGEPDEESEQLA